MVTRRQILLVEDSPEDQDLILIALRRTGVQAHLALASNAEQALAFLEMQLVPAGESRPVPPDLVLVDLGLPGIDGLELLRRIRKNPRTRNIPVIVLTYSEEQRHLIDAFHAGANGYILKWPDFRQFTQSVAREVRDWLEPEPNPEEA